MEWKPKPWLAALLGLLAPPIGMLYVQRPWWALVSDDQVPDNQFVVFGDNRDNSRDSRFIGMVDRDAVIGRVVKVFRSTRSM